MTPPPLAPAGFAGLCPVSRETLDRLAAYVELLRRWQERINLVGSATLGDAWRRHVLDSAQLAPWLAPGPVLDIGSGAGFPGLVLAILAPRHAVTLVESDHRKCAFLAEAARLTATPVTIIPQRIERVAPFEVGTVVARAVAPLDRLLAWAAPFLGPGSRCLFLKGEGVASELTAAGETWKMIVEPLPSQSDPRGTVLRLGGVHRVREP